MKIIRRTSLQWRFFKFSLAFSLVILAVTLGMSYYNTLRSVSKSTSAYLETYIGYADQAFTNRLNSSKILASRIASDQKIVQAALSRNASAASYDWFVEQLRMRSYLDGLVAGNQHIRRLNLITETGNIYQSSSDSPLFLRDLESDLLEKIHQDRELHIAFQKDGSLLITRPVIMQGAIRGLIRMELDPDEMFAEYELQPLEKTSLLIFDESENLIRSQGPEISLSSPLSELKTGFRWIGRKQFFVLRHSSSSMGLTAVGILTMEELFGDALHLGKWMLVISLAAAVIVAGIAWLFSRSLFGNLNILMECMRAVRKGDLTRKAHVSTRDEISEAADSFNTMMDQIQTLLADIRTQEAAKRVAEQQMLEAQIQPHFVYNSISAMQYTAQLRGQTDIEEAASALGELMRSVLGNHSEWITLWEERTYIEKYIVLQRFKFKNHFTLRWEVEEELWGMPIPKLLLQPLVENALIHGIHMEDNGEIVVSAAKKSDRIILSVSDNGKGMEAGAVEALMTKTPASLRRVGIANVRERIRLCYHGNAQFNIISVPDSFTCVELDLPYGKEREEYGAPDRAC